MHKKEVDKLFNSSKDFFIPVEAADLEFYAYISLVAEGLHILSSIISKVSIPKREIEKIQAISPAIDMMLNRILASGGCRYCSKRYQMKIQKMVAQWNKYFDRLIAILCIYEAKNKIHDISASMGNR